MSKTSGSSHRVSSWLAEPMCGVMLSPAPMVTPPISTSQVVVRLMREQRRFAAQPLLNGLGQQRAVGTNGLQLVGVGEQQVQQVARRAVGGLGPGRQEEPEEGVDGLVGELLAVDLGRDQVADDVLGRLGPPLGHDSGEVLPQRLGGGQPTVDVGHQPDELDRPALELREVLLGKSEQARRSPVPGTRT